jgi:hypothetical protein
MALPTTADLKLVLKIQTTAEDALLASLLLRARAVIEGELGRPIVTVTKSWREDGFVNRVWGGGQSIAIPVEATPFDPASLQITDVDSVVLTDTADYWAPLTGREGVVRARPGIAFSNGPYTVEVDAGLDLLPDYATLVEPAIGAAILDYAASLYQERNAAATSESTGGGVSTSYVPGMPQRVRDALSPWKAIRA